MPLIICLVVLLGLCNAVFSALSVVIIGGGPTGLGAAIEARSGGAHVVLVEKRREYSRWNILFLSRVTLELFERWNVPIPFLQELPGEERSGFISIKDLEVGLANRLGKLRVRRVHGEFVDFAKRGRAVIIHTTDGSLSLPYDILVGADGAHSKVREKLGISCLSLAETVAGVAMIPAVNEENTLGGETQPHVEVLASKVKISSGTLLSMQRYSNATCGEIDRNALIRFASEVGWKEEAMSMQSENCLVMENFPVHLRYATTFSDPVRSAILLGDAAGETSFFQGMGVNFSLKTVEIAGEFFRSWPQKKSYEKFNHDMTEAVECLMQDGLSLFE